MTGTTREHEVEGGFWWSGDTWTLRSVQDGGGALPETGAPWLRVPGWVVFPLAPVVGAAFVVALPLVGAFLLAQAAAKQLFAGGRQAARELAATVAARAPRTGQAHLTGGAETRASAPAPPAGPEAADPVDELKSEVERARARGAPR